LQTTLKKILDTNKQKKKLTFTKSPELYSRIREDLKVLNKVAEKQAKLVQLYESQLGDKQTG